MDWKGWGLAGVCLLTAARPEDVVRVPPRGEAKSVSLTDADRAQREVASTLAGAWRDAGKLTADTPFDSGLPACGARRTRRASREMPPELVGKTIGFGPSGRIPAADVRVATSAARIAEVDADGLADPALAERLDVRCRPTRVRVLSEVELELVENP